MVKQTAYRLTPTNWYLPSLLTESKQSRVYFWEPEQVYSGKRTIFNYLPQRWDRAYLMSIRLRGFRTPTETRLRRPLPETENLKIAI